MKFSKIRPDTARQARERQELIFYWQRQNIEFAKNFILGKHPSLDTLLAWKQMRQIVKDLRDEQKKMIPVNTIWNKIYWFIKDTLKIKSR